jgi:hypothetical protein
MAVRFRVGRVDFFAHVDFLTAELKGNLGLFFDFDNLNAKFSPLRPDRNPTCAWVPALASPWTVHRSGSLTLAPQVHTLVY